MRVDLLTPVVSLRANQRATITIQVRNDSDVIEQVVCSMPELNERWYEVSPLALNLFPGELGELRLTLALPRSFPAGRHELNASISGRVRGQTLLQPVAIDVDPLFDMLLVTNPSVITARRRGRYLVTLQNRGNIPVEMAVRASDSEAALTLELDRPVLTVEPNEQQTTALFARGRRPWFGAPANPHRRDHRRAPARRARRTGDAAAQAAPDGGVDHRAHAGHDRRRVGDGPAAQRERGVRQRQADQDRPGQLHHGRCLRRRSRPGDGRWLAGGHDHRGVHRGAAGARHRRAVLRQGAAGVGDPGVPVPHGRGQREQRLVHLGGRAARPLPAALPWPRVRGPLVPERRRRPPPRPCWWSSRRRRSPS